jgi:hypothetical protein
MSAFEEFERNFGQAHRQFSSSDDKQSDNSSDAGEHWRDPDWSLLDDRRGDLPEFPVDVLSNAFRAWLMLAARGAGVGPDQVVIPLLTVASTLVGASRVVMASRSWPEQLALWTSVVGFSGSGKTPGLNVTLRALAAIERDRKSKIGALKRSHELRVQTAKEAAKKWKTEVAAAVEEGRPAPEMPSEAVEPGEFVQPRLSVTNTTIERLPALLQARPSGFAAIYDELAGLFSNMGRYSNGSDREFWLEAWNGQRYVVERQGRPAIEINHLLVGLTGGLQPDKLASSFKGDCDGMYARFLFSWPREPAYQPLSNDVDEVDPAFQNALARLADLPQIEDDHLVKRSIWLSDEAIAEFEQFRQMVFSLREALDGREREWSAKGPSQVLRLAGTLCLLEWAMTGAIEEPQHIDLQYMRAAIRTWSEYFLPHARAALRQIGLTDRHANVRRVLRWARAQGRRVVSREDVRREALAQYLDATQTQNVIDGLVTAGWLRDVSDQKSGPGRKARRWAINPALWRTN